MFVGRVACFIYWDEGSQLAKSIFESVDGLDTFDVHGNNQICEAFLSGCWLGFASWDKGAKMRKALIYKLDIIIHLDYLKGMDRHKNVWYFIQLHLSSIIKYG